jgi:Holliday junction resolvasome RuvABC ATP-dependent DNA helicase subunit
VRSNRDTYRCSEVLARDVGQDVSLVTRAIGMPGLERRLSRYPQLYSRVGFVHQFRTLGANEIRAVVTGHAEELGVTLGPEAFSNPLAVAAIIRASNGNFRLIQRLLQQIERVLELNELVIVTPDVVAAARESLVIGAN